MFVVNACAMRCVRRAIWIRFRLARLPQSGRKKGEHMPHVVTKSDLVQVAAKASNLSKSAAGDALNAVFEAIVANVASSKRVTVVGFGTFLPRQRKARAGSSTSSGKGVNICAQSIPALASGHRF